MRLLDRIGHPGDLKTLNLHQLNQLAEEIREELVVTVSRNGGHLAPNLGVVELTLALHLVFDSPRDQIVWDVGHQSYVHKLLTGRGPEFGTLRQYQGLSGFPKPEESVHDIFATGHSSTSISAALGLALARDLQKKDYYVLAVIGDGALTGGMAFEALNHAGHLQTKLIVILNDNEMSIANNVGALSRYLNRLRTEPFYFRSKEEVEYLLRRIPKIGSRVLQAVDRFKDAVKYLVVPGMFFEELGFTYLGPIDGHNLSVLREILQMAKQVEGPVLIHLITKKGKGYGPAERNPDKFHGIGPFDIPTGQPRPGSGKPSYTQIFGQTLIQQAEKDDRILAITAAMSGGTGLEEFARRFPQRFFDVGIAEQHAVTLAAGLAAQGFRPVVALYSTFLQRAYDQVLHDVCMQKLPVTLAIDRAGLVGEDGATHQGVFDLSFLRPIPHLTIMAPKDENELQHCLETAFQLEGPVAVRYPRGSGQGVLLDRERYTLPLGKGELVRDGQDLLILALGPMVYVALEVADTLQEQGINTAVINPRFIKPLDTELIGQYTRKLHRLVTLEEHCLSGGFGSAVLETLPRMHKHENREVPLEVLNLGLPDAFIEHGSTERLREVYGLNTSGVLEAIKQRWPKLFEGKVRMAQPESGGRGTFLSRIPRAVGINQR
ncbi:MAG: 1-deoxy-D-xylulose-5-phosphate synthase [Syntrophomonadaceae bacterium]|nr:1-deoxy-D-xylulose-5-phosphate synthase [Syntrophomonadaceae bacterium]